MSNERQDGRWVSSQEQEAEAAHRDHLKGIKAERDRNDLDAARIQRYYRDSGTVPFDTEG